MPAKKRKNVMSDEERRKRLEETAREIDLEVRKIMEDAAGEVRAILCERRPALGPPPLRFTVRHRTILFGIEHLSN